MPLHFLAPPARCLRRTTSAQVCCRLVGFFPETSTTAECKTHAEPGRNKMQNKKAHPECKMISSGIFKSVSKQDYHQTAHVNVYIYIYTYVYIYVYIDEQTRVNIWGTVLAITLASNLPSSQSRASPSSASEGPTGPQAGNDAHGPTKGGLQRLRFPEPGPDRWIDR